MLKFYKSRQNQERFRQSRLGHGITPLRRAGKTSRVVASHLVELRHSSREQRRIDDPENQCPPYGFHFISRYGPSDGSGSRQTPRRDPDHSLNRDILSMKESVVTPRRYCMIMLGDSHRPAVQIFWIGCPCSTISCAIPRRNECPATLPGMPAGQSPAECCELLSARPDHPSS